MARRIGDDYVHPLPDFALLPPIPPAHLVERARYMGPTDESNWVLDGCLLVGAYPCSQHDATTTAILTSILGLGVTTFVCLQQEYQHEGVTEEEWRSGAKLRPYIFDAIRLVDTLPPGFFKNGKISGLEFVHFPIQGAPRSAARARNVRRRSQRLTFGSTHAHTHTLAQTAASRTTPASCSSRATSAGASSAGK